MQQACQRHDVEIEEVQDRMEKLGIAHVTLQIERERACGPDSAV